MWIWLYFQWFRMLWQPMVEMMYLTDLFQFAKVIILR